MEEYKIIGFADEFYTLWGHNRNGYFFIKNISKDINVVKQLYPDLEIDLGLRGTYSSGYGDFIYDKPKRENNKFPFGKYQDKSVEDIIKLDFNYCLWVINNDDNIFGNTIKNIILNSQEYNNYILALETKIQYLQVGDEFTYTFDKNIPYQTDCVFLRFNNLNVKITNIQLKHVEGLYPYSKGLVGGKFINFKNKTFIFKVTNILQQSLDVKFKSGNQTIEVEIL